MPELPEVQTVVSMLAPRIVGARVAAVHLHRPDILTPAKVDLVRLLTGARIHSISRRGKRIIFELDDGNRFYIHLGMSGRLTLEDRHAPLVKHTHLVLEFAGASPADLHFRDPRRFGGVFWMGAGSADVGMGPEPLTITAKALHRRLLGTSRSIKAALLDQRLIAGLGNIYVDEALFSAGINPRLAANRISAAGASTLTKAIKRVLHKALRHRGSTLRDYVDATGNRGNFQNLHRVYDRAGTPCALCKSPIRRIVLGGRSTHFCPKCQGRGPGSKERLTSRRKSP